MYILVDLVTRGCGEKSTNQGKKNQFSNTYSQEINAISASAFCSASRIRNLQRSLQISSRPIPVAVGLRQWQIYSYGEVHGRGSPEEAHTRRRDITVYIRTPTLWIPRQCVACFEISAPSWGACGSIPKVSHHCPLIVATSSGVRAFQLWWVTVARSKRESVLSNVPWSDFLQRIGEVRWCRDGLFRFTLFRIRNHAQPHQNPERKSSLPIWFFPPYHSIASVPCYPIHCFLLFRPPWSQL